MTNLAGRLWAVLLIGGAVSSWAQLLGNQTLSGKYYFRYVSLGTDGVSPFSLPDARSLIGVITFDGSRGYTYSGQQVTGSSTAIPVTRSGTYTMDAGGFVSLDNPLPNGATINARYGSEALIGSSTEGADHDYDLFIAVPAPVSGATLSGAYTTVSLEFPGGATTNVRDSQFTLKSVAAGVLAPLTVIGHAANISAGRSQVQQVTGATYTMGPDGSGALTLGQAASSQLLSGGRTLYISRSGNVVIGGSTAPGAHDVLIGVKAIAGGANSTWNNTFWSAGLRVDSTSITGYVGSAHALGNGKLVFTRRFKTLDKAAGPIQQNLTGINAYSLAPDGSGTLDLTRVGLGAGGGGFAGVAVNDLDAGAYEIYFGVQIPTLSAGGVFVNPLGVLNAASFAPPGNPIAPGQFVTLYGSGMAKSDAVAAAPYPAILNGVVVRVNGEAAPVYFVSDRQINFLAPYSTAGPTAAITVQNGSATSNIVTVPVAATAPGVYTLSQDGAGPGAILHADYSVVNGANPAAAGETVLIFLTGLGAVNPPVADGTAGNPSTLYNALADVGVLVAGKPATVVFKGLAPGYPGLYQMNVKLPSALGLSGNLPLAIYTNDAYHDQVDLPVK